GEAPGEAPAGAVSAAVAAARRVDLAVPVLCQELLERGVAGREEVAAASSAANVNIKLYPDADGRVGHIDVDDRSSGTRLGALTQGASGFAIRPGTGGAGGMRFAAVPITIPPQQIARDRGFVSQVHLAQTTGRQI